MRNYEREYSSGIDAIEKNNQRQAKNPSSPTTSDTTAMKELCVVNEWDRIRPDQIPGF